MLNTALIVLVLLALAALYCNLNRIEGELMAAIDDLNAQVSQVVADEAQIKQDIAKVLALLTASTPDLSGAIAALQTLHSSLAADDADLQAAETPTP